MAGFKESFWPKRSSSTYGAGAHSYVPTGETSEIRALRARIDELEAVNAKLTVDQTHLEELSASLPGRISVRVSTRTVLNAIANRYGADDAVVMNAVEVLRSRVDGGADLTLE